MDKENNTVEFQCWLQNCIRDAKVKLELSEEDILLGLNQAELKELLRITNNIRENNSGGQ